MMETDRREQDDVDDTKSDASSEISISQDSQIPIMEEKEHLQVYLRIRPFTSAENTNGESQDCVTMETPDTVLLKPPSLCLSARLSSDKSLPQTGQRFQFSQVYGPETSQKDLFTGTVKDLVKDVLTGGNSLVFTYGVTNAGKTFTFLGPDGDAGILPRSLDLIFSSLEEHVFTETNIKPQRCREFTRLSSEQQSEEAAFKRGLFRQLKESERGNASMLNATNKTFLEGTFMCGSTAADRVALALDPHTKFSVWVSFCEIYNENIHDLLESVQSGAVRRTALRLSQDVKGNAFVKDLRWVQVNSAEEAYKVMKLGKTNQSFSSTRLNQLSSRSHSMFSIRILRIDNIGSPRVHTVSELCLCDLAGSERCAKTQNKGDRLKEAGNINTSMLILGKCINALRHNQQAKLLQHVPFRESKLTHYLQGFFCGRGRACMIVNINQCASMYDETLNVLKFSAVAQKIVVLTTRPVPIIPKRSASEISVAMSNAERKNRRSSLIGWDTSLEDVQEGDDDEEQSLMDDTMDQTTNEEEDGDGDETITIGKKTHQRQAALLQQLQLSLKQEQASGLLAEARVRDEISREFSELFSEMQNDYNDRLSREREILEERAERRLEIFKKLIDKMAAPGQDAHLMDVSLDSDLSDFKKAAEVLEQNEHQRKLQEQMAQKHHVESTEEENEEKSRLQFQLQEKCVQVARLEKQVAILQKGAELKTGAELDSQRPQSSQEREGLEDALASLETERKTREEVLAALEYQTMGKEDALKSLEEEREAREAAIVKINELKHSNAELLASLEEQTRRNAQATVAVATVTAATRERLSREERVKEQNEIDSLRQEFKELTDKLEATERQVNGETERAEQAFLQLQTAQEQLEQHYKENQEKTSQISTLTQEVQNLKEDGRNAATSSSDIADRLREKLSEHRKDLFEEKEKNKSKDQEMLQMEHELTQANEKLAQLTENFNLQESASKLKDIELRRVEENSQRQLDEVRAKLEGKELEQQELRAKSEEQAQASEKQVRDFNEKLQAQELASRQHLDELKQQLNEQKATSDQLLMDLKANIGELERNAADEATSKSAKSSEEDQLKRLNSGLQAEVESLKDKVTKLDEISKNKALEVEKMLEQQLASAEMAKMLKDKDTQLAEKLAEVEKKLLEKELEVKSLQNTLKDSEELSNMEEIRQTEAKLASTELDKMLKEKDTQSAEKLAEFEKTLLEKESEVKSLQKSLKQAEDSREEESVVLKEKISKMEEKRQTEARLASSEMEKMLKEKDTLLAGKLIHLEKMLHEKESEVKSVQKSLKQAEDRLAETKVRKERKSEMQKIYQSEARLASLELDRMIKEKDIQLAEKLADLEKKLLEKESEVKSLQKSLKDSEELSNMEEKRQTEAKLASAEMEKMLKEKDTQLAEKLADLEKTLLEKESEVKSLQNSLKQASECHEEDIRQTKSKLASSEIDKMLREKDTQLAEKLADLEKKLREKESEVKSLQKSLKQASERREEEESEAVQEARRREVERRRELLAVAHEAIAQKDEDLEKKAQEINRLKENGRLDSEKVKSLSLDLQRKDDDTSDLKEKLADYKKQIQQVQKEISTMREEENSLKQKLSDTEKVKKQLQNDVANRDRMIHQLKVDQPSNTKSDPTLYEKACKDLESKEAIMEDMRLALTEQEETQEQMETILEEKLTTIDELSSEVDKLKGLLLHQDRGRNTLPEGDSSSDDVKLAKQETAQAQEKLKLCTDKHQTDRRKWLDEKLSLIGQAKEAEDKRNQEMRKFAEDRERYNRQQGQLESLSAQLSEKDQTLDTWRQDRDTLVKALEVQLMKLLSSQSEKDKLIQQLQQQNTHSPPENGDGCVGVAELQAALSERETEIQRLKDQLQVFKSKQEETDTQTLSPEAPASSEGNPDSDTITRKSGGRRRDTRASVTSQSSTGYPSVLESSEISTENGRMRRFPKPEMEISFSPLKPNHMALRRHGDHSSVTVKITRSARKRKSEEMGQEEIEAENRRNTKTRLTPKLTPHKEELSLTTGRHDSQSSIRSKKDGALQKIGDFLHSSPTMLGSKAKKMMGLMSGRSDLESASSSSSLSLRAKKSNRKLYRPEISTPMDMPSHPIINRDPEEKDSDHQLIKRRLRTRMAK